MKATVENPRSSVENCSLGKVLRMLTPCYTQLQVLLDMARNLSIGIRCIKDSEGEKSAKKRLKIVLQSAHIQRVSVSRMSVHILPSSRPYVCKERRQILTNIHHVNNFKSIREPYFPVEFPETCCVCSGFWYISFKPLSRIPGGPKWTFSSPQNFKLSSGEPKVIQLVSWYHVLFLGP